MEVPTPISSRTTTRPKCDPQYFQLNEKHKPRQSNNVLTTFGLLAATDSVFGEKYYTTR